MVEMPPKWRGVWYAEGNVAPDGVSKSALILMDTTRCKATGERVSE